MKKRILAAILAVAMIFSVCTIANADWEVVEGGESVTIDFNDENYSLGYGNHNVEPQYSATEGVNGSRCMYISGAWKVGSTNKVIFTTTPGKTYKFSCKFKGCLYQLFIDPISKYVKDNDYSDMICRVGGASVADWTEESFIFTANSSDNIVLRFMSGQDTFYLDDVKIEEVVDPTVTKAPEVDDTVDSDREAKILCIGDSITHGCGASVPSRYFTSYRYPLWKKLIDAGVKFEMVGPKEGNLDGSCIFEEYKGQTFNNKHYAQFGIKLEEMKETIGTDCANTDFNVAIINLGTNDRKVDGATEIAWTCETLPTWLAEMTNTLRTINPEVTVFLTGLIDSWPGGLNEAIQAKAEEITTAQSPVHYVPAPAGWIANNQDPNTCTLDWCHPNEKGCQMMADTYYDALVENFFLAEPYVPTPTPIVSETPIVSVTPIATKAPVTTTSPSAMATVVPTATATVTPVPESPSPVVKVKFKKSKVTIKKGKKKVLKVTLKNAKKAKFSVNKKGKKVVKLSKKKAKSVTVKGKKKGKATITAKAAGKKAKCKVTVK